MPINLTLIPFAPKAEHSSTLLGPIECTGEFEEAVRAIQDAHGRDVPLSFNTFRGEDDDEHGPHYCNTQEDAFGERLKHVDAEQLVWSLGFPVWDTKPKPPAVEHSWLASAALSYLSELPPNWRVALYWH